MTTGRRGAGPFRGISSSLSYRNSAPCGARQQRSSALFLLRAVAAAGLLAVADTLGVERTADDLVTDAGQVTHTTAADEHDRVLLQVVADAGDVGRDLDAAGQAHTGDL